MEVKTVINVGDILRQAQTLLGIREGFVACTSFHRPVTSLEHQALMDEGVVVVVR